MGADPSYRSTEIADFLAVLYQTDDEGKPFIVVGGHAVNYWASLYLPRELRLNAYLPFTSKDLDLVGSERGARRVAEVLGWQFSPPPLGGGPVQGIVTSGAAEKPLRVEFLSEIKGLPGDVLRDFARENTIRPEGSAEAIRIRVLDPAMLLYGKLRNAVDLEQDAPERPRQDVKHASMLGLCMPHFLSDLQIQIADTNRQAEEISKYIKLLLAMKTGYSGRLYEARHPGTVVWSQLVPSAVQRMPWSREVRRWMDELQVMTQSRGIRM